MSFLKSVGIDVGIIEKSLHHKIDSLDAEKLTYDPVSIGNWGVCGCTSLGNIQVALDALAQVRALDVDDVNDLDNRLSTLETGSGSGSGLTEWTEDSNGHLLPDANDSQDIGNASQKVRDLYLGTNSLKIVDADDSIASYGKDWFEGRASTVSLGNVDTRVSGLETLSTYTISSLPASSNDGTQALVSDGADTGVALAYHYDRAWHRSFDNVILADSKWSPADTTTQLWYDASDLDSLVVSGSDLTQWGDKSGNGYHLTKDQNANDFAQSGVASLRGRNVIEISSGDTLTNRVWNHDHNTTALYLTFVWKAYTEGTQDFILHHTDTTSKRQALRRTTTNQLQWLGSNISGTNPSPFGFGNMPEGDDNLTSIKANGGSSWLSNYNALGRGFNSGDIGDNPFAHISVGANEIESNQLIGYIAEIIYYTNESDTQKIEGYLAHKWGLSAYLTSDHDYKNSAP